MKTTFLTRLKPVETMTMLSVLAAVLLLVLAASSPAIALYAPLYWSVPILGAGIWVMATSPPLAPIASLSALWARLAWLGKYTVAGLVLLGGLVLAPAFEHTTSQERVDGAISILGTFIVPVGCSIAGLVMLIDLARLRENVRRDLIGAAIRSAEWIDQEMKEIISFVASGLSNPILVGFAALAVVLYISSLTA